MRLSFYAILLVFVLTSCSQKGLVVKGSFDGVENITAYFDEINAITKVSNSLANDESSNGAFSFNFPEGLDAGIYRVRMGAKAAYLILDGDEKEIELAGDIRKLSTFDYAVTGSPASDRYQKAMQQYRSRKMDVNGIQAYVKNEDNPLAAMQFALNALGNRPDFAPIHAATSKRVLEAHPESDMAAQYASFASQLERQWANLQAQQRIKVGEPAPDIRLPDPDGKEFALSDLKGKVVLLDFWASWCGPCRKANPHVVQTYHKYKDRGFTVYSVSLDGIDSRRKSKMTPEQVNQQLSNSKKRWIAAIQKDKLEWDTHVSDLKKWDCAPAATYGVRSIPQTFLIDRDGKIAAVNPRYTLEEELLKVL